MYLCWYADIFAFVFVFDTVYGKWIKHKYNADPDIYAHICAYIRIYSALCIVDKPSGGSSQHFAEGAASCFCSLRAKNVVRRALLVVGRVSGWEGAQIY